MHSGKKSSLFWPLVAIGEMVVILFMVPANCRPDKTDKETPTKEETREPPKNNGVAGPICADGENCPSEIIDPIDDGVNDEADDKDTQNLPQSCTTAEDCGCGYGCSENKCRKLAFSCCTNTDCDKGLVCIIKENEQSGTCMLSQCDTDEQCGGQCGVHCKAHRCEKIYCCADSDCPAGKFCDQRSGYQKDNGDIEGDCATPQCNSNADCGCGEVCREHSCNISYYSESPVKCCGTDVSVFYNFEEYKAWACVPHECVENGRCVNDSNCPKGQVCYGESRCFPATCAENSNCGCEAVCRKGRCELGCDKNSDCCDEGNTCDRGWCRNSNAEEYNYKY